MSDAEKIEMLSLALRQARLYAHQIGKDAITSLQSLRASLIQEVADRALGDYPPKEDA